MMPSGVAEMKHGKPIAINIRTQTYVLPEKDKSKADELEKRISQLLSGDNNVDVCTLLSILNKKMKK